MAELKALLERRVEELETELNGIRAMLEFLNSALLAEGFKRASLPKTAVSELTIPERTFEGEAVPIKTIMGELLANLYIKGERLRLVPAATMEFSVDTPPFKSFLIDRVLEKMKAKDRELIEEGRLQPDKALRYTVSAEDGFIHEIVVDNVTKERLQELKSTIRWTFEKMYEKIKKGK